MIQLSFNGALSTVGSSAVLVDTGVEKILMDYGTKIQETPPKFPIPVHGKLDAILASHSHLDHIGGIPIFYANGNGCPVFAVDITKPLSELLLSDSIKISRDEGVELPFTKNDVEAAIKNFVPIRYKSSFKIHKTVITAFDAGHIPGSCQFLLDTGEKTILYTGDIRTTPTRLLEKADTNLPKVDILVTESTYADREHAERKKQEKELVGTIRDTLAVDGICLIAGFAVGRIDELLLVLNHYGIDYPVFVDGMAKKAITIINQHKNLLRTRDGLDNALKKVQYVASERMRKRIIKDPCVILSTSGMLSGGPIVWYLKQLFDKKNCSLVLTSYQVEGTPGRVLLETGRFITKECDLELQMFVKRFDFSSHCGRSELFEYIRKVNPEKVFCVHGDHTEEFAAELRHKGFDATAPIANNRIFNV